MYQVLIDRFADMLVPFTCGVAVWFGVHYFVLTPRILKVEMPRAYVQVALQYPTLPDEVHHCFIKHYASTLLRVGRLEATLFTASLKHIRAPMNKKSLEALDLLDVPCGKTKALEAEKERRRMAEEQQKRLDEERRQLLIHRRQEELARLKHKAMQEARARELAMIGGVIKLLFGGQ